MNKFVHYLKKHYYKFEVVLYENEIQLEDKRLKCPVAKFIHYVERDDNIYVYFEYTNVESGRMFPIRLIDNLSTFKSITNQLDKSQSFRAERRAIMKLNYLENLTFVPGGPEYKKCKSQFETHAELHHNPSKLVNQ